MKLEQLIATRYLFARNGHSVANTISWVSLIGLLISTAALIVVLSVYNGIGELTKQLFSTFDAELVIEPAKGRTFHLSDIDTAALYANPHIAHTSQITTETAWLTYGSEQAIVTLRGVDGNYAAVFGIDTLLHEGYYDTDGLIVGGELWYRLGMGIYRNTPAAIHIPRRGTTSMGLTIDQAFNTTYLLPMANFFIQQDIDRRYVITSIDHVRRLMNYAPDECSSLAIALRPHSNVASVKRQLSDLLASSANGSFVVKDRYDQQPLYFKIFRTERLGIYLILSLIVLISTLSLAASLSLLIIDKQHDIFSLKSLGFTSARIRRTFLCEGLLICALAVVAGLFLGFLVCLIQQQFGIIGMGDGNFVVSAFPVAMRAIDFLLTFAIVMLISSLTVVVTVRHANI